MGPGERMNFWARAALNAGVRARTSEIRAVDAAESSAVDS
jgi:hypothetical protein